MPENTWIATGSVQAEPSFLEKALDWIKNHRETFIGSVVILLGVIAFSAYFFVHYRGLRDTAWKNLFIAQQIGFQGNVPQAQEQLAAIERSYGRTSAAPYATMTKGDIFFAQGNFKEAGDEYAKVLGDQEVGPFALYNLGKAKEAASDLPGAMAQYSEFLSKYPEHFMAPEAHASLARAQELSGSGDLARTSYEKIVLLYPDTGWAMQAKARLGQGAPAKK